MLYISQGDKGKLYVHCRTEISIPFDSKQEQAKILVHKITVERGLCAMEDVSGSHWPIRMLQIIAIESNCDARRRPTAAAAAAAEQCVRQKWRHFESSAHSATLSLMALCALSSTKRLRPRAEAEPARAHQYTDTATGTHNENTKRLQCVFAAAGKRNKLAN